MKKLITFSILISVTYALSAQISVGFRTETVAKYNMGFYSLKADITTSDTTYYMALQSNNQYHGSIIVMLGSREEARTLLKSMYEYTDTESDVIIQLNNPSKNWATYGKNMGVPTWFIHEENGSGRIYGYLTRAMIEKFYAELRKYGKTSQK